MCCILLNSLWLFNKVHAVCRIRFDIISIIGLLCYFSYMHKYCISTWLHDVEIPKPHKKIPTIYQNIQDWKVSNGEWTAPSIGIKEEMHIFSHNEPWWGYRSLKLVLNVDLLYFKRHIIVDVGIESVERWCTFWINPLKLYILQFCKSDFASQTKLKIIRGFICEGKCCKDSGIRMRVLCYMLQLHNIVVLQEWNKDEPTCIPEEYSLCRFMSIWAIHKPAHLIRCPC